MPYSVRRNLVTSSIVSIISVIEKIDKQINRVNIAEHYALQENNFEDASYYRGEYRRLVKLKKDIEIVRKQIDYTTYSVVPHENIDTLYDVLEHLEHQI